MVGSHKFGRRFSCREMTLLTRKMAACCAIHLNYSGYRALRLRRAKVPAMPIKHNEAGSGTAVTLKSNW